MNYREPTSDECATHAPVQLTEDLSGYASWYPQMGGYVGKAVAVVDDTCVDVYVWHDGEFPFGQDPDGWGRHDSPLRLHHCDPDQFIAFGHFLNTVLTPEGPPLRELPRRFTMPNIAINPDGTP